MIVGILLFASALLTASYAAYHYYLQGSEDCQTNYVLSTDTIQCGYGNSLQYDGAEIKGCPIDGDVMTETLNAWQIRDDELILYSQTRLPVKSNGLTTDHLTFLLLGWQIYTWKNSIIAGFCCIANDNDEEKTASLHMFRHSEDAYRFQQGEGVRNAILSEQIHVPPNKTFCFQKWGTKSPFTVTHSSYHYIGVDLPANMNYTANITVTQSYVNISDYPNAKPKQFRRDNHTHFTYPHTWVYQRDYLYICKAPLIYPEHKSKPDSVSLHICTCNEPYPWMKPTFTSIAAFGGFGILLILTVLTCCCLRTNRHRLCANQHGQHCPCFKNGYTPLNEQSRIQ